MDPPPTLERIRARKDILRKLIDHRFNHPRELLDRLPLEEQSQRVVWIAWIYNVLEPNNLKTFPSEVEIPTLAPIFCVPESVLRAEVPWEPPEEDYAEPTGEPLMAPTPDRTVQARKQTIRNLMAWKGWTEEQAVIRLPPDQNEFKWISWLCSAMFPASKVHPTQKEAPVLAALFGVTEQDILSDTPWTKPTHGDMHMPTATHADTYPEDWTEEQKTLLNLCAYRNTDLEAFRKTKPPGNQNSWYQFCYNVTRKRTGISEERAEHFARYLNVHPRILLSEEVWTPDVGEPEEYPSTDPPDKKTVPPAKDNPSPESCEGGLTAAQLFLLHELMQQKKKTSAASLADHICREEDEIPTLTEEFQRILAGKKPDPAMNALRRLAQVFRLDKDYFGQTDATVTPTPSKKTPSETSTDDGPHSRFGKALKALMAARNADIGTISKRLAMIPEEKPAIAAALEEMLQDVAPPPELDLIRRLCEAYNWLVSAFGEDLPRSNGTKKTVKPKDAPARVPTSVASASPVLPKTEAAPPPPRPQPPTAEGKEGSQDIVRAPAGAIAMRPQEEASALNGHGELLLANGTPVPDDLRTLVLVFMQMRNGNTKPSARAISPELLLRLAMTPGLQIERGPDGFRIPLSKDFMLEHMADLEGF